MAFFGNKLMTNPSYVSERGRVWTKTMRLKKWKCSKGCLEKALYFEKYTKPLSPVTISSVFDYSSETYHSKWKRCMTPGHLNGWKTTAKANGSKRWVGLCWISLSLQFRDQELLSRLLVLSAWLHSLSGRLDMTNSNLKTERHIGLTPWETFKTMYNSCYSPCLPS